MRKLRCTRNRTRLTELPVTKRHALVGGVPHHRMVGHCEHRVTCIHELPQTGEQPHHIIWVQSSVGLVEQHERA